MINLLEQNLDIIEKLKRDSNILCIIIFGSYAEDKIKPLSDLDICIIPKNENYDDYISYGDEKLDISNFYKLPKSLQYKIITKGKIIHNRHKNLKRLKRNIIHEWFDFRVLINRSFKRRGYPQGTY
jgi:predicted nucleotidyltransferase